MKLHPEQIQALFQFTEKKFVHWYDLQIELVDHLASRIEEEMEANPALSFEAALEKVYRGFGIFGFAKIVQEKSAQLERAASKMWWKEVWNFFSWPRITFIAFILAALWQLAQFFDTGVLLAAFAVLYITINIIFLVRFHRKNSPKRKLMLLQSSPGNISFFVCLYQGTLFTQNENIPAWYFCALSTIGILIILASFHSYAKLRKKAVSLYPEAFEAA